MRGLLGGWYASRQAPRRGVAAGRRGAPVDFNWDVRPILSDNCFRCHGPDEKSRQADLRLDTARGRVCGAAPAGHVRGRARQAGREPADLPRHARERRRADAAAGHEQGADAASRSRSCGRGSRRARSTSRTGRSSRRSKAAAPAVPRAARRDRQRHRPVRRQARLEREGLTLSPQADKETLINRVTLTLTGLPPTLAEVDAFLKDTSPSAYEKLVDRLLASPAYGEHMASSGSTSRGTPRATASSTTCTTGCSGRIATG